MRLSSALLGLALEAAPDAGAAAATVVDHVAREQRLLPAVYLARGGRLRCAALRGYWQARDGLPGRAGIMGRTYRSGIEIVVDDVSASEDYLEANPGVVAEACFPLQAGGLTVGVLNIESREALRDGDLEHLRECARALGARIDELGGLPSESGTQRLLRHVAEMAALQDAAAVADALLSAALDLVPLGSALLARATGAGRLRPSPRPARWPTYCAPRRSSRSRHGSRTGSPSSPSASPTRRPRPISPSCAPRGSRRSSPSASSPTASCSGALVLASDEPAVIGTDDVELLEQLANHGAACLRTAELMGSLRERAETDPLTGLGHHATFHEALAGSHRRPTTAVVVCDIDGFKLLNDTYGHGHGDRVLCGLADAMSGALRRGDRLFRVGGDEFAALLAVDSSEQALGAAMRLREAVLEARLGVTISVGVAVPQAGETDVALLARADRALYSVKAAGRDGVALANDEPLPSTPALG